MAQLAVARMAAGEALDQNGPAPGSLKAKLRAHERAMRGKFERLLAEDVEENPPASEAGSVSDLSDDDRALGAKLDPLRTTKEQRNKVLHDLQMQQQRAELLGASPTAAAKRSGGMGQWTSSGEGDTVVFDATGGIRSFGTRHAGFVISAESETPTNHHRVGVSAEAAQSAAGRDGDGRGDGAGSHGQSGGPQRPETEESTPAESGARGNDGRGEGATLHAHHIHVDTGLGPSPHANDVHQGQVAAGTPLPRADEEQPAAERSRGSILSRVQRRQSGVALADDPAWTEEKAMILLHLHNPSLFNLQLDQVRHSGRRLVQSYLPYSRARVCGVCADAAQSSAAISIPVRGGRGGWARHDGFGACIAVTARIRHRAVGPHLPR